MVFPHFYLGFFRYLQHLNFYEFRTFPVRNLEDKKNARMETWFVKQQSMLKHLYFTSDESS
jgi:hypothetical protein